MHLKRKSIFCLNSKVIFKIELLLFILNLSVLFKAINSYTGCFLLNGTFFEQCYQFDELVYRFALDLNSLYTQQKERKKGERKKEKRKKKERTTSHNAVFIEIRLPLLKLQENIVQFIFKYGICYIDVKNTLLKERVMRK